jgi:CheY-like chemotaxis protein
LARDLGFSVALVDLNLRGEDGLTLIRQLRENFPDLPVIAIGGVFQRDALKSAQALGAVEVLRKPITKEWKPVVERIRATSERRH